MGAKEPRKKRGKNLWCVCCCPVCQLKIFVFCLFFFCFFGGEMLSFWGLGGWFKQNRDENKNFEEEKKQFLCLLLSRIFA